MAITAGAAGVRSGGSRSKTARAGLVFRRPFGVIYYDDLRGAFRGFHLKPKLLLKRGDQCCGVVDAVIGLRRALAGRRRCGRSKIEPYIEHLARPVRSTTIRRNMDPRACANCAIEVFSPINAAGEALKCPQGEFGEGSAG